jgi:tight adherence protein B
MKQNYDRYRFTGKEWLLFIAASAGICIAINGLFYLSWWAFLPMIPLPVIFYRIRIRQCIRERRRKLNYQFKDALVALGVALQAGYSVENAVKACAGDLEKIYPETADILKEFHYMEAQLKVSVPVEELFLDFARRSQVEDIENFASVFAVAKRTGGDMVGILQKAARMLGDKIDVKREIEATISGKKWEQRIMSTMPIFIILYMRVTSPDFLKVLYGNLFGVVVMTICLGIYVFAWWMGRKIVDIRV